MTYLLIQFLCSLLIPFCLGWVIICATRTQGTFRWYLRLALSWGIGTALITLWMAVLSVFHLPLTYHSVVWPLIFFSFTLILIVFDRPHSTPDPDCAPVSSDTHHYRWESFFIFLLVSYFILVFWRSLQIPVVSWDAMANHAFKAKVLFYENGTAYLGRLPHPAYPLHIPFSMTWIALCLGQWDDQLVKGVFPVFYSALATVLYGGLRYFVPRTRAFFGTALLLSLNLMTFHGTVAYADLPLAYYLLSGIVLLTLFIKTRKVPFLLVGGFFLAGALWTKVEGTGYVGLAVVLGVGMIFKSASRGQILSAVMKFCLPVLSVLLLHGMMKSAYLNPAARGWETFFNFGLVDPSLEAGLAVLYRLIENLLFTNNWHLFGWVFILFVFSGKWIRFRDESVFLKRFLILACVMFIAVGMVTSRSYFLTDTPFTLSRLLLHIMPIAVFLFSISGFPSPWEVPCRYKTFGSKRESPPSFWIYLLTFLIAFGISTGTWMIFETGLGDNVWQDFVKSFYTADVNAFMWGETLATVIHKILIATFLLGLIAMLLIRRIGRRKDIFLNHGSIFMIWMMTGMCVVFQLSAMSRALREEMSLNQGLAPEQKYQRYLGEIYEVVEAGRTHLPEASPARFMSGMETDKDPGMMLFRAIRYLLYPVDIGRVRKELPRYLIVHKEGDLPVKIPAGYPVLFEDKHVLICEVTP